MSGFWLRCVISVGKVPESSLDFLSLMIAVFVVLMFLGVCVSLPHYLISFDTCFMSNSVTAIISV